MRASHKVLPRHIIFPIPEKVVLNDLQNNYKLLSDAEINRLLVNINKLSKGRNKKNFLKTEYAVSRLGDSLYAIYKGVSSKKILGSGKYGYVKLAQNLQTGEWIAVKIIKAPENKDRSEVEYRAKKEIKFLKEMGQYIGSDERRDSYGVYQIEIFMKLYPGISLAQLIKDEKVLAPIEYLEIMLVLLKLCDNLLKNGIIHRDLKDQNIMFEAARFLLSIIDYGLAARANEDNIYVGRQGTGTSAFMAPELIETKHHHHELVAYGEKTELYALAITFSRILDLSTYNEIIFGFREGCLISVDNENFTRRIIDKSTRKQIKTHLDAMAVQNPDDRPSLSVCLANFKTIHDQLCESQRVIMVGCIDIGDLLLKETSVSYFKALNRMDRICLLEPTNSILNPIEYVRLKRILQERGMFVFDEVVRFKSDDTIDAVHQVNAYLQTLPNANTRRYTPYFMLSNKANKMRKEVLTSENSLYLKPSDKNYTPTMLRFDAVTLNTQSVQGCLNILKKEVARLEDKQQDRYSFSRGNRLFALNLAVNDLSFAGLIRFGVFNKISKRLTLEMGSSKSSKVVEDALNAATNHFFI